MTMTTIPIPQVDRHGSYLPNPLDQITIVSHLIRAAGDDPTREGLRDTGRRFWAAWAHYTSGYRVKPESVLKVFEDGAERYDELVIVRDIRFYSMCEHHFAPFYGVAHIGYLPRKRIVGLSKLPRLLNVFARRLQVQERLTQQVADAISSALEPAAVGVVIHARHLCMEARGVQSHGVITTTSAMLGRLREDAAARAEFLALLPRPPAAI